MKINVKSKGTQPTCQMPFVLSCEHWIKAEIYFNLNINFTFISMHGSTKKFSQNY